MVSFITCNFHLLIFIFSLLLYVIISLPLFLYRFLFRTRPFKYSRSRGRATPQPQLLILLTCNFHLLIFIFSLGLLFSLYLSPSLSQQWEVYTVRARFNIRKMPWSDSRPRIWFETMGRFLLIFVGLLYLSRMAYIPDKNERDTKREKGKFTPFNIVLMPLSIARG